jgi:hypothetical protein
MIRDIVGRINEVNVIVSTSLCIMMVTFLFSCVESFPKFQKHRQRLTTHEASSPRFKQLQTTRHDRLQTNMHELPCWIIDTYTGTTLYGSHIYVMR